MQLVVVGKNSFSVDCFLDYFETDRYSFGVPEGVEATVHIQCESMLRMTNDLLKKERATKPMVFTCSPIGLPLKPIMLFDKLVRKQPFISVVWLYTSCTSHFLMNPTKVTHFVVLDDCPNFLHKLRNILPREAPAFQAGRYRWLNNEFSPHWIEIVVQQNPE